MNKNPLIFLEKLLILVGLSHIRKTKWNIVAGKDKTENAGKRVPWRISTKGKLFHYKTNTLK